VLRVVTELPTRSNRVRVCTHTFGSMRDLAEWLLWSLMCPGLTGLDERLARRYSVGSSSFIDWASSELAALITVYALRAAPTDTTSALRVRLHTSGHVQ